MIDFLMTLACYTLVIFLFYDRVEAFLAGSTSPKPKKTMVEEVITEVVGDVLENIEDEVEDELRADNELERTHRLTRIRKRLLPADEPS